MIDKDSLPLDKPRRTPDHPTKSHVVKTRVDGKEKIIRFGEQGAKTAGKPKEGESEAMKQKRASFKARHAKNIAKGKSSPAYWADKVKWATGGSVDLEDLDEKYEGIKKPDFTLLESFRQLIRDLQARAEESGTQEFDPLRALGRSGAAESLEDLYASYADRPRESHARRAEAGAEPVTEADMGGISAAAEKALAALRASWSGPEFDVISGYRDPEHNKRVGGAKGSQHLHGNAFDINTAGWTPEEKLALADAAHDAGFRGFGFYNNNLHFDVATPRAWGPSYKRESVPLWAQDWVAQRFNEGGRVKRDPEMTEAELIEGMFKSEDGIDRLNDYMRKISRAGTVGKQAGRLTGIPFGGNIGRLIAEAIAEEQFSQEQGFAEGGLAQLAHKYDKGGKKKDDEDELARAVRLRDLELMAEPKNPNAVPAEDPRLLNVGGLEERLAFLNQTLNPVEAIGDAMSAGRDLMASDAGGYDRLEALGRMLSGVAGVAGPAAVAKRIGAPAATAVMESLLGASPTAEALADMGRKYAVDESGALRLYQGSPHDFAAERLVRMPDGSTQYIVGKPDVLPDVPAGAEVLRDFPLGRMRMDKIGTGEGAQAYGHGLYGAEAEGVARGYRDQLSRPYLATSEGQNIAEKYGHDVANIFEMAGGEPDDMRATVVRLRKIVKENLDDIGVADVSQLKSEFYGDLPSTIIHVSNRADRLESLLNSGDVKLVNTGRMYEVEVNANPEDFIDFDAPWESQPEAVKRHFAYLAKGERKPTGEDLAQRIEGPLWAREAAQSGIPGIRYLDASSRSFTPTTIKEGPSGVELYWGNDPSPVDTFPTRQAAEEAAKQFDTRSRNYVIFDENLINIVRKYGIAGAAAMLGVSAADVEQAMAQGNVEDLDQKYAEGGKVNTDDELERAILLRDLELMAEERSPDAVPAQDPSLLNVGGVGDRLALINKYLNPVEAIGESMDAGSRMMSPGVSGYDRLEALGDMLSGVAGVAGPAAVAKRVGAPAANAVMDALVGGSPTSEALSDMARKYATDESGALRLPSVEEIDPAALQAEEVLGLLRSGREDEITEQMLDMGDPVLNARLNEYLYRNYDLPMDAASRAKRATKMGFSDTYHGTGSDISAVDPSFFGSGQDLLGSGFYTTTNTGRAERYVPRAKTPNTEVSKEYIEGGNIMPLMVKEPRAFKLNEPLGNAAESIASSYEADPFFSVQRMSSGAIHIKSADGQSVLLDPMQPKHWALQNMRKAFGPSDTSNVLSEIGYSGVAGPETGGQTVRASYNPSDLRSRFARFDPRLAHLRNLSAGVAAGAIGASQYDPDAIETTAARVRENKFAAGGAVKYDPGAVDRIITKLREVNRG